MRRAWEVVGGPLARRYRSLLRRLHDVEVALDAMILSPVWELDLAKVLNGQRERQRILGDIIASFRIAEVIETGTFLGDTTGYVAHLLPSARILSCELSPRFCALARRRLERFSNCEVQCSDSRSFLERLEAVHDSGEGEAVSFVYLDAHWHEDLPLRGELIALMERRKRLVIMIDDFAVAGDRGYAFDRYGRGKDLELATFRDLFERLGLRWYFPVASSKTETGYRRGCIILAPDGEVSRRLGQIPSLRAGV